MDRAVLNSLAFFLVSGPAWSQLPSDETPNHSRIVLGGPVNADLAAGASAIRAGDYDEGIRLTLSGLEDRSVQPRTRALALSNICAAYAAKQEADTAIQYCTESLAISSSNWQAFSNRSYAYWIKGQYAEASIDLDAATALSPLARQVAQIRGMINEATLQPRVTIKDLQ